MVYIIVTLKINNIFMQMSGKACLRDVFDGDLVFMVAEVCLLYHLSVSLIKIRSFPQFCASPRRSS